MKGTNLSIGPFLWLGGKNYTYKAGDTGPIPGSGRSPGEGNGNHSSVLAWKIPWTEAGGLQSVGITEDSTKFSN